MLLCTVFDGRKLNRVGICSWYQITDDFYCYGEVYTMYNIYEKTLTEAKGICLNFHSIFSFQ